MKQLHPTKLRRRFAWALGLALVPASQAQTTPPPATTPAVPEEELIVLSPFEVVTTQDVGYLAQNTLAGSRLNTSLKDTAAAISVLTPEFMKDIGATSMKDVILFQNNAVPEFGDSAANFNANPMIGNPEWQLRIRGLPASYARNYFTWRTSSDFYNVERIDQSRGPNSILFGFGAAGGIVNTTTKQANFRKNAGEVVLTTGSWNRYRGSLDVNRVLVPDTFALRLNLVGEDSDGWREFESYKGKRGHLAGTFRINKTSSLRGEVEVGDVKDNVARPWLMIDQTAPWRAAGSPTYNAAQWSSNIVNQTWSEHLVYIENNNTLADWKFLPFSYSNDRGWAHLAMTPQNLAIIPRESNPGGPAATRETDYNTYSVFYENQVSDAFSFELAYNHQSNDFLGYDPDAGNLTRFGYLGGATELWADASTVTPTGAANPYAGKFYVENNWTRRTQTYESDNVRATAAYKLDAGKFGTHRIAGLYERAWSDYYRREDSEVFVGRPFDSAAEFDSNRVFRRYYIQPGNTAEIRVPTWQRALANVTDPISGRALTSGWAPNQDINNADQTQDTFLIAWQGMFFNDRLVTTAGYRRDVLDYFTVGTSRNAAGVLALDAMKPFSREFKAGTTTLGGVFHITKQISVFANHSNSRDLPNVNQKIIGVGIPPMPEGTGSDFGLKFDLFNGKAYATASYYTTDFENTSEWGNIFSSVTGLNNRVLERLAAAGLITAADRSARILDANAYLEDRKAEGWEFTFVANPTSNWRVSANFSINGVVKENIMNEVKAWADTATAYWLSKAPGSFELGGGSWDTLSANIGWLYQFTIDDARSFNGLPARGERKYGANLYTHYSFSDGPLKHWYVGGGGRYQSANTIGMNRTTPSNPTVIKGKTLYLADASIGRWFEFDVRGRKLSVDVQLNVSNLFDSERDQVYTTAYWDTSSSIPERIGLQEPRKFTLSATVKF
jgi:iron complex outermembrane recepter protein